MPRFMQSLEEDPSVGVYTRGGKPSFFGNQFNGGASLSDANTAYLASTYISGYGGYYGDRTSKGPAAGLSLGFNRAVGQYDRPTLNLMARYGSGNRLSAASMEFLEAEVLRLQEEWDSLYELGAYGEVRSLEDGSVIQVTRDYTKRNIESTGSLSDDEYFAVFGKKREENWRAQRARALHDAKDARRASVAANIRASRDRLAADNLERRSYRSAGAGIATGGGAQGRSFFTPIGR